MTEPHYAALALAAYWQALEPEPLPPDAAAFARLDVVEQRAWEAVAKTVLDAYLSTHHPPPPIPKKGTK